MKNRTFIRIILPAVLAALLTLAAPSADAARPDRDTPGCVTAREASRTTDATVSKSQTQRVFGARGWEFWRKADNTMMGRKYFGCQPGSRVWVYYRWHNHAWRWWGTRTSGLG